VKHLLLRLATTPERALRLLGYCVERSDEITLHVDACGTVTFSDLDLPGVWSEPDPAHRFRAIRLWMTDKASDPALIKAFCCDGGKVAAIPEDADLLVATGSELSALEERWPRRLVVSLQEIQAQVIGDQLRPLNRKVGPPGSLPKQLRGIWNQLRSGSVKQILEGLEAFSSISETDSATADLLLTEVGVDAATGTLILGNRFERVKEEANPHLLYALLGLLSRSAPRSRGAFLRRSVRCLKARCPSLPEIRGFEGLRTLEADLHWSYSDPDGSVPASIAERFGPMPALERLHIDGFYNMSITSLDGLDAPFLRDLDVGGIGLSEIKALQSNSHLERVVLRSNEHLSDISPLQASLDCLKQLEISSTAVSDLGVLSHAGELEELDFSECTGITSLKGLEQVTVTGGRLSLDGLTSLTDLRFLPKPADGELCLWNLSGLTSLDGIACLADHLISLEIHSLLMLKDLGALRHLHRLERLQIDDCPQITSLEVLADLPCLKVVRVDRCKKVSRLPAVWPAGLEVLTLENCGITRLGKLPSTLGGSLNLVHCPRLLTLEGIEQCTGLSEITIRPSVVDLQALAELPDLWISIDFTGSERRLPDPLIDALAALPQCRLRIGDNNAWSSVQIKNPDALARITHLQALDLSTCELDDIQLVMGLAELELLKVRPRSDLSKKLGGCSFHTPGDVAKLKLQLLGMS